LSLLEPGRDAARHSRTRHQDVLIDEVGRATPSPDHVGFESLDDVERIVNGTMTFLQLVGVDEITLTARVRIRSASAWHNPRRCAVAPDDSSTEHHAQ
jgi:hypothetical protein